MAEKMLKSTWSIAVDPCGQFMCSQYATVDVPTKVSTGETTNPLVLATFRGAAHVPSKKRVLFYGHVLTNLTQFRDPD